MLEAQAVAALERSGGLWTLDVDSQRFGRPGFLPYILEKVQQTRHQIHNTAIDFLQPRHISSSGEVLKRRYSLFTTCCNGKFGNE